MAIDFVILSKNTSFCAGFTRNLIPVSQYIGFHQAVTDPLADVLSLFTYGLRVGDLKFKCFLSRQLLNYLNS